MAQAMTEGVYATNYVGDYRTILPYKIQPYTLSVCPDGQPPPPTRREAAPRRFCVWNLSGRGIPRPYSSPPGAIFSLQLNSILRQG